MKNGPHSILQLITADHDSLRESIKILKNETTSQPEKKRHLERFLFNLKVHSQIEEKLFYESLVGISEIKPLILEGYEEHHIADHLANELNNMNFQKNWSDDVSAKAKVLVELIEHHAEEEETDLFPKVRSYITKKELENLGVIYLQKRKELRRELESRFTWPSIDIVPWARVSSFISSKFSISR